MSPKKWWVTSSVTLALVGLVTWTLQPQVSSTGATPHHDGVAAWFRQGGPASIGTQANAASAVASAVDGTATLRRQQPASPLDTMILPTFRATDKGTLVMDQQTRQDVERIHALFPRDEALARLDIQASTLPAQAQRELRALYQQYNQYAQAVAQTYPPGLSNGTLEEATQQLKGLHDLRQQYFGADGAQALFGEEEKTSQELLELMRKQTDLKLSLEEKAELAQAEWQKRHPPANPTRPASP